MKILNLLRLITPWIFVSVFGLLLFMFGWDEFVCAYFKLPAITLLEAVGCWVLIGLALVPVLVVYELVRERK